MSEAVESLAAQWERLVTFFDFPAEHWKHLRTTNPIESAFATVRLRERATKGAGSRSKGLLMAFKLLEAAQEVPALAATIATGFDDPRTFFPWWFDAHEAERLIDVEKVPGILGIYSSAIAGPLRRSRRCQSTGLSGQREASEEPGSQRRPTIRLGVCRDHSNAFFPVVSSRSS